MTSSVTNVIVTDTSLTYAANDTSIFILKVPSYYGGPISTLSPIIYSLEFNYWLNLDSNAKATIEFSVDDGLTWKDLLKDSVHYLEWDGSDGYHVRPSFDTSTHGWRRLAVYSEHLSYGSPSDTTLFRFTFLSGNNDSARDGWMIDNMRIGYYSEGVDDVTAGKQLDISPNPTNKELNITTATGAITSVAISNLVGQTLYSQNYHSEKQVPVDVSKFPIGAYIVKINGTHVLRFIKQ